MSGRFICRACQSRYSHQLRRFQHSQSSAVSSAPVVDSVPTQARDGSTHDVPTSASRQVPRRPTSDFTQTGRYSRLKDPLLALEEALEAMQQGLQDQQSRHEPEQEREKSASASAGRRQTTSASKTEVVAHSDQVDQQLQAMSTASNSLVDVAEAEPRIQWQPESPSLFKRIVDNVQPGNGGGRLDAGTKMQNSISQKHARTPSSREPESGRPQGSPMRSIEDGWAPHEAALRARTTVTSHRMAKATPAELTLYSNSLRRALMRWCYDRPEGTFDPVDALRLAHRANVIEHDFYVDTLWTLCRGMKITSTADNPSMDLLFTLWRRFLGNYGPPEKSYDPSDFKGQATGLPERLVLEVPKYRGTSFRLQKLAGCMLMTVTNFRDYQKAGNSSCREYDILRNRFRHIIATSDIEHTLKFLEAHLAGMDQSLGSKILTKDAALEWIEEMQTLKASSRVLGSPDKTARPPRQRESADLHTEKSPPLRRSSRHKEASVSSAAPVRLAEPASQMTEEDIIKQLGRAVERVNVRFAASLWEKAERVLGPKGEAAGSPSLSTRLYGHFIQAFMVLNAPEAATRIWNTMLEHGVQPTIETWTSTMAGCAALRDVKASEEVWQKMVQAGIVPDAHAWGTRINALISGGKVKEGLQCLEQMGQEYRRSQKASIEAAHRSKAQAAQPKGRRSRSTQSMDERQPKAVPVAAAPTPDVIAATISALARLPKKYPRWDVIEQVLSWATAYGIEPNAYVYNPLVRLAFDRGDDARVSHYLKLMEVQGIKPDEATETILIKNMFRVVDLSWLSPEDLNKTVLEILRDLEGRITLNTYHYTTLVDGLMRQDKVGAVRTVMNHMTSKEVNIPASILTILARYYFSRDPPDIKAADALWQRACGPKVLKDIIFFDRMVEGYAKSGEIEKMMTVLKAQAHEGKRAGWQALADAAQALFDVGDLKRLRSLIGEVRSGGGQMIWQVRAGSDSPANKKRFWDLARQVDDLNDID